MFGYREHGRARPPEIPPARRQHRGCGPPCSRSPIASQHDTLTTEGHRRARGRRRGTGRGRPCRCRRCSLQRSHRGERRIASRVAISRRCARVSTRRSLPSSSWCGHALVCRRRPCPRRRRARGRFKPGPVRRRRASTSRLSASPETTGANNCASLSTQAANASVRRARERYVRVPWYSTAARPLVVRDAHSSTSETFGELGFVGLSLVRLSRSSPPARSPALRARRTRFVHPARCATSPGWRTARSTGTGSWSASHLTALLAGSAGLLASGAWHAGRTLAGWPRAGSCRLGLRADAVRRVCEPRRKSGAVRRSRCAGAAGLASAREQAAGRRVLLVPWSLSRRSSYGDAAAGLGDRRAALRSYRKATTIDPGAGSRGSASRRLRAARSGRAAYRRGARTEPPRRGTSGRVTFRNRLALGAARAV